MTNSDSIFQVILNFPEQIFLSILTDSTIERFLKNLMFFDHLNQLKVINCKILLKHSDTDTLSRLRIILLNLTQHCLNIFLTHNHHFIFTLIKFFQLEFTIFQGILSLLNNLLQLSFFNHTHTFLEFLDNIDQKYTFFLSTLEILLFQEQSTFNNRVIDLKLQL